MRILVLALLLAGCAATPADTARAADQQRRLAEELAGFTSEPATACLIDSASARQIEGFGPTILYKVGRGLIYRTDTTGGCEQVGRGDILVTTSPSGRPCSGDIATTISPTSRTQTGSCALGDFVRYRRR